MNRHMSGHRRRGWGAGYTLVEMLMATTLTLIMMGTVAVIFGRLGEGISASRATIEMSEALRATVARLRADLEGLTIPTTPDGLKVPLSPDEGVGYFQYTEGLMGPRVFPWEAAIQTDVDQWPPSGPDADTTVGDIDDCLAFTTRSQVEPLVGRIAAPPGFLEARDAEVIYFVRGTTLYRRQLLVAPSLGLPVPQQAAGFHDTHDVSVRAYAQGNPPQWFVLPNNLADLTKPENRFAHLNMLNPAVPYHPWRTGGWGGGWTGAAFNSTYVLPFGFPTLGDRSRWDTSANLATWDAGAPLPVLAWDWPNSAPFDAWLVESRHPWKFSSSPPPYVVQLETGVLQVKDSGSQYWAGPRAGEDVVLNNVISFDVKAWDPTAPVIEVRDTKGTPSPADDEVAIVLPGDPGNPLHPSDSDPLHPNELGYPAAAARIGTTVGNRTYTVIGYGAYVDLGYGNHPIILNDPNPPPFPGSVYSGLGHYAPVRPCVYDTWSLHYENNGLDEDGDGMVDEGADGLDNDNNGLVDDPAEWEAPPPYSAPLRGIQIKIRVFEPDSRQIREVTIVHDFCGR